MTGAVRAQDSALHLIMDKEHPLKIDDVEMGKGAATLEGFKKRRSPKTLSAFQIARRPARARHQQPVAASRADLTAFITSATFPYRPKPTSRIRTRSCKRTG